MMARPQSSPIVNARRLLLCWIVTVAIFAAGQRPTSSETKKCKIEGSVASASGEPIKKALIEVISETHEHAANYSAVADQEGHFRIADMQPGRYTIFAERTGFIQVDNRNHRSPGVVVALEPGQAVKELLVRMLPAAAINGRVIDEDGDPIPNVDVTITRKAYPGGREIWDTVGSERTNDIGQFRLGGLFPGRYFIAAIPPASFQSIAATPKKVDPANPQPETSYVPTYYPGTIDRGQAAALEIRAGEELPIDFNLVPSRTFNVRGELTALPRGADAAISLLPRDLSFVATWRRGGQERKL